MYRRANRLLPFLLVLLVGAGPIASAMANPHVCAAEFEKDVIAESMTPAEHARHLASSGLSGHDQQPQSCADCDSSCCSSGACSASSCGGVSALLTDAAVQFDFSASGAVALDIEQPLSERHSPPFRPPQV